MRARTLAAVGLAWALSLTPGAAYYHYTHFTSLGAAVEKFDLRALPGGTVTFYVSDAGLTGQVQMQYGPNDGFPAVLSQVRDAAAVWNAIDSSSLRVAFGGLTAQGTPQATPGGLVVFDDIPPGLVAFSTRSTGDVVLGPDNVPFVPITQGLVHLNRNLAGAAGPSYAEAFFTTVVHEMGHALGLQHTFTSSAMSTAITRSTSRATPLGADDVAGISVLYPGAAFRNGSFGSITGKVTSGGQGVNLASVVALGPNLPAVSALTNPDGTYRIDGLPPAAYWVYVHPIPPTADILAPTDSDGQPIPPSGPTETLFYPGTRDPGQFAVIGVGRGTTAADIDFSVESRDAAPIYDVSLWGVLDQSYIPPYVNTTLPDGAQWTVGTVVASGNGITSDTGIAAGLGAQVLGGSAAVSMLAFGSPPALALYVYTSAAAGSGPRHLFFTLPNDAYVLPSAIHLVEQQPPVVAAVEPNADGSLTVTGSSFSPDSQVFFDGLPATVQTPFTGDDQLGTIVVTLPAGASGQTATITVFNPDGQNSMFKQSQNPPVFTYGAAFPFALFSLDGLPVGASAMVEVTAGGTTSFVEGQTTLGFGSSDVTVNRTWVLSPTRLVANVTVAAGASPGPAQPNVMTGFQIFAQPNGFQVRPADPLAPSLTLPVVNAAPGQNGIFPGAAITLQGSNLAIADHSAVVLLNDRLAPVLASSAGQVIVAVPADFPIGPAVLRLYNGATLTYPLMVQVDPPPPAITGVTKADIFIVSADNPAKPGDILGIYVAGLDPNVVAAPGRVRVDVGGTHVTPFAVSPAASQSNVLQVRVVMPAIGPSATVPITVTLAGTDTTSAPFQIAVE